MRFKFFLTPALSSTDARYQFASLIIAQGLEQLNVPFGGNINFWYEKGASQTTIRATTDDAEVHIYDGLMFRDNPNAISMINKSKVNVLIDMADGFITEAMTIGHHFDVVLRAHFSTHLPYAKNVHSWPFALSNRIIEAIDDSLNQKVLPRTLASYRVNLDLRKLTNDRLLPLLEHKYPLKQFQSVMPGPEITEDPKSYWWQTGRRHDTEYYKVLNQSRLSFAFGGILIPKPYPANPLQTLHNFANRVLLKAIPGMRENGYLQYIIQYDSWRLWESFASNACPVYINFEQWGLQLPVNPVAGEHYLDVDVFDFKKSADKILALSDAELVMISKQGREWALKHYSPLPMAQRFLNLVDAVKK